MAIPQKPFDNIALSMSGGGYRATSFHLGVLTFLEGMQYKDQSLLKRISVLSTVSGGTFTGVKYAANTYLGKPLEDTYRELYEFMEKTDLPDESLRKLSRNELNPYKSKNLINAFSEVYHEKLFGEQFELFWDTSKLEGSHLSEICFNGTEFSYGLNFRFQKSSDKGLFGNYYTKLKVDKVKQIRLADIVATSSCFPGGFEPMLFPNDYRHPEADEFNEYAKTLIDGPNNHDQEIVSYDKPYPMSIMDGGIYDNQGIDSVILASKRLQNEMEEGTEPMTEDQKVDRKLSLFIISDVSSPFMEPLQPTITDPKGAIANLSFQKMKGLSVLFLMLAVAAGVGLTFTGSKLLTAFLSAGLTLSVLASLVTGFLGGLLLKRVPKWFKIPAFFMKTLEYFQYMKFGVYEQMILTRKNAVLKMVQDVFLKQIRRLSYERIYVNTDWEGKRITNTVYEMEEQHMKKRRKKEAFLPDTLKFPGEKISAVATNASSMGTTLWFTPDDLKSNKLNDLIACGQFTICFNLMQHIERFRKDAEAYKAHPERKQMDTLYAELSEAWEQFKTDPSWMLKEWNLRSGVVKEAVQAGEQPQVLEETL